MKFYTFNSSSDKVSVNYNLSLGLLNTERKPLVKRNGRPGRSVTGQPVGRPGYTLNYTGRVENILTGSTSDLHTPGMMHKNYC